MIPQKYPLFTSAVQANYDTIEIATGKGIVTLYGGDVVKGTAYILSDQAFYADIGVASGAISAAEERFITKTFDLSVNKPLIVNGEAIANVPWLLANNHTGNMLFSGATSVILSKVDTSDNATVLASKAFLGGEVVAANGGRDYRLRTYNLTVPRTVFKSGEKIRLIVSGAYSGVNTYMEVYYDPANRSTLSGASIKNIPVSSLTIKLPFKTSQ